MINRDTLAFRTLVLMARQRPDFDELRCHALLTLFAAAEDLRTTIRQRLQTIGLTEAQFGILIVLLSLDPEPVLPSVLSEHAGVTRASVSEAVDQLAAQGLALRHRSTEDRRNWLICLSASGRELADRAAVLVLSSLDALARPLDGQADARALLQLCEKLLPASSHTPPPSH
jgi:DNA-binding MarR family transcriptional regulator